MRLAGHIAGKDLRRMALPMAAWLALIILPTIVFSRASPVIEGHVASSIDASVAAASIWARLLFGIRLVLGYVLVGALVLEDPVVGTTAFWLSRPIRRGTLLGGKLIAAAVLFLVVPLVALTAVWLANGFSVGEVGAATWEFVRSQGSVTLVALLVGSLARNLVQFILFTIPFFAVDLTAVLLVVRPFYRPLFQDTAAPVLQSRDFLVHAGVLPVVVIALVQQFLTRRTARTWSTLAAAFVVSLVIRTFWPWDIVSAIIAARNAARFEETSEDRAADIIPGSTLTTFDRFPNSVPFLYVDAPWRPGGFFMPALIRSSDGQIAPGARGSGAAQAGLRTLGVDHNDGPLKWQLTLLSGPRSQMVEEPHLAGRLEIWSIRPRVMGELPLQVGGQFASGATRTRILELGRHANRLDEIFLEERDSYSGGKGAWPSNWSTPAAENARYVENYFLWSRTAGQARWLPAYDLGSVEINSLFVRYRRLNVTVPESWRDAVLVKLRFECDHRFQRPLEVQGLVPVR